jgi:hypothetical protein
MAEKSSDDRPVDDDDTKREGRGSSKPPKAQAKDTSPDESKDKAEGKTEDDAESEGESGAKREDNSEAADSDEAQAEEKPRPKPAAPKKDAKPAPPPEPGFLTPTNVALLLAAAGLGAFWKGWSLYRTEGRDFYSASAWLFLIAFFMVTVSAFHFLSGQIAVKPGQKGKSLLEALVPTLPFFALYGVVWWSAWDAWSVLYGSDGRSWMWRFFIALALASWGVWYALRPPSPDDIKADRLPTRRVVLLLMLPFVTVYGMIWMAERAIAHH